MKNIYTSLITTFFGCMFLCVALGIEIAPYLLDTVMIWKEKKVAYSLNISIDHRLPISLAIAGIFLLLSPDAIPGILKGIVNKFTGTSSGNNPPSNNLPGAGMVLIFGLLFTSCAKPPQVSSSSETAIVYTDTTIHLPEENVIGGINIDSLQKAWSVLYQPGDIIGPNGAYTIPSPGTWNLNLPEKNQVDTIYLKDTSGRALLKQWMDHYGYLKQILTVKKQDIPVKQKNTTTTITVTKTIPCKPFNWIPWAVAAALITASGYLIKTLKT